MSWRDVLSQIGTPSPAPLQDQQLLFADGHADARQSEIDEYGRQYTNPDYRMGHARRLGVRKILKRLPTRGALLDVGTGRGETLDFANEFGFSPVMGTEVVPELLSDRVLYAEAHALPFDDRSFAHVTCFDVLEHLLPDDVEKAIRELWRVTRETLTVSASTVPSVFGGRDLHISARSAEEWGVTFSRAIGMGAEIAPAYIVGRNSPVWRFVREA